MLKHIVMWQLKDQALGQTKANNAKKIKEILEALNGKIEGMLSLEIGINALPDPQAFDLVLIGTYDDEDAFKRYLEHPDHIEAAEFIGQVRSARTAVDYFI